MRKPLSVEQHKALKMSKIDKVGGCWIWRGQNDGRSGYGTTRFDGKRWKAHRLFYTWHKGAIPNGAMICHSCDTPACCNPDHLFVGTQVENMADMKAKGRANSTLTAEQVLEIRQIYRPNSYGPRRICHLYGVSIATIRSVVNRKSWTHL